MPAMPQLAQQNLPVNQLIEMYSNGVIAIPEIQRDFVWDATRIRLLLDSIQNAYPSGAIILWRPEFKTQSEFEMFIRPRDYASIKIIRQNTCSWMVSRD